MELKASAVIGSNYGDESKGTIVARLCKDVSRPLVVLTNGGSQRGHSVVKDGKTYTYKHFGSGTHFGADNFFAKSFILNPLQFVKELSDNNIPESTICWRDTNCRWSTPFDIIINLLKEESRGEDKKHGSCGMGIWETVSRYNSSEPVTMPFDDFCKLSFIEAENFLKSVRSFYDKDFKSCSPRQSIVDYWYSLGLIQHFINDCHLMHLKTTPAKNFQAVLDSRLYQNIIFENGQGLLLTDPGYNKKGTTPSNTGLDDIISLVNPVSANFSNFDIHYVTRPYLTRHGMDDEFNEVSKSLISSDIKDELTNPYNETQGAFKYSYLDLNCLAERINRDYNKARTLKNIKVNKMLNVTHCDEMDRESEFKKYFNTLSFSDRAEI